MNNKSLLQIKNLSFAIGQIQLLKNISFSVPAKQIVGLVGESGSGKTLTARAILGFLYGATGSILLDDQNLLDIPEKKLNHIRGKSIGLVCQNPLTSFNPTLSVGTQLIEGVMHHKKYSKKAALALAEEYLHKVGLPHPKRILTQYPDQLSGGMRQRAVIAMTLMCEPRLLIADEPTTSLDVTTQAQILDLLVQMQDEFNMSILLITHDLGIVAGRCAHIHVLKNGELVDSGTPEDIFYNSRVEYTRQLCWKRL